MSKRWCDSAKIRRDQIEKGLDITFNKVFKPIFVREIVKENPKTILELGAGTGHLSKEISKQGYSITAIEPSRGMFEVARDVLIDSSVNIRNCSSSDLEYSEKYDLAYSHMVAHVVDDLSDFFSSALKALHKGGKFIFSIPHPCFYNNYKKFFGPEYSYMRSAVKNVSFRVTNDKENVISDVPYHHRPLSNYLNLLSQLGFSLEYFEELFPCKEIQDLYGSVWKEPRYCLFVSIKV